MKRLLPLLLLAAMACERAQEPPKPQPRKSGRRPIAAPADVKEPPDNLLELAHGGVVLSRTGEHLLELSAAHVIDGDPLTTWKSPPNDPVHHDLVYALPALARITTVGVHAGGDKWDIPLDLRFDLSTDASNWREVARVTGLSESERYLATIPPSEARYVRVRILPGERGQYYTAMRSIQVKGEELEPPKTGEIAGCWTINTFASRFEQQGSRVFGIIQTNPPTFVSGARDARTYRLMWTRGPQWGYALVTVDAQRRALSGVRWHETVSFEGTGEAWFGQPSSCGDTSRPDELRVVRAILERAGRWTAYSKDSAELMKSRFGLTEVSRTVQPINNESMRVMAEGVELGR